MKQVYIHGLGQRSASWEKMLSLLHTKEDNQTVCQDLAEIVREEEVNYKNLYQAFSNFCNEMDGSIDLCGLSLGGVIALNYAIDYPEKVNSLVLIAAQYKMPKTLLQFQNVLFRFMPKSMFQQIGFEKKDFIHLCKSMMELDFSSDLQSISCPVLVIYGEKDTANKKASMEMADLLENAEIKVVKGAGHEVNVDAPEKLAVILNDFYRQVS